MYPLFRFSVLNLPHSFTRSPNTSFHIYRQTPFRQMSINALRPFHSTAFVRASADRTPFNSSLKQFQEPTGEDSREKIEKKAFPELFPDNKLIQSTSSLKEEEEDESSWYVDPSYNVPSESIATIEDFVPLWQRRARERELEVESSMGELTPEEIVEMLKENRMEKVVMIDLREKSTWAEYMFVAESKGGERFLGGVAEEVARMMKRMNYGGSRPSPKVEGRDENSDWLLIDGGRYVVHLFTPEARTRYNLEELWENIPSNPMLRFIDENISEEELKARVNESLGIAFGVLKEKD